MSKVKLGEVAREYKATVKSSVGMPTVGLEHLIPGEILLEYWDEGKDNTFTKSFKKGQMLFGRRRAYLKKAAVAPFDGVCSGDITVIEAIPEKMNTELLPFIIQNDLFFDYAVGKSAGSLSPRVKWESLKEYEFDLPDLNQQNDLVDLLKAAYRTKKAYQNLITATDNLVKSQFIEMIYAQGYPTIKVGKVLHQIIKTERIVDTSKEKYVTVALHGLGARERNIDIYDPKPFSAYRVKMGQFIYSRIDARNGAFSIVPRELDGAVVSKDFPVFDIDTAKITPQVLMFSMLDQNFLQQIKQNSLGSTNRQRIKEEVFLEYQIVLPPISVQRAFEQLVEQSDKSKFELKQAVEKIDNLIKSLILQDEN